MDHPAIFQPLQLRHLTLRNRIVFGAHTANMSEGGLPGERHLGYYRERAMGGAAMIVVEPVPIHKTAVLTRGNFRADDDAVIPHFRRITEAVHAEGAHIIQQLYHVGAHGDWDNSLAYNWSPSGLPSMHDSDGSHAMTQGEIAEIVAVVRALRRAGQGQRLRRLRADGGLQRADRAVLVAGHQPARRQIRRQLREPHALLRRSAARRSARRAARISSSAWRSASIRRGRTCNRSRACRRWSRGSTSISCATTSPAAPGAISTSPRSSRRRSTRTSSARPMPPR